MTKQTSPSGAQSVNAHELHGMACGLLCGGSVEAGEAGPVELLRDLMGLEEHAGEALDQTLFKVLEDCHAQIAREDHSFEPLLPDDESDLGRRTAALARWCDGFLSGFGASAGADVGNGGDLGEILGDLAAIAQVDPDSATNEQEEWNFFELKEYVRMAVISLYLDRNQAPGPDTGQGPGAEDIVH